jgi:glycine/D-amino acid oxidase-like deaminating enzyme
MKDSSYDVVIVGGGVNGSSAAYHLASQPDFQGSILVIERDPTYEGAPSALATGGIRQQFSTPENIQIGLHGARFVQSIDEHLAVDDEPVGLVFREQGYCLLATPRALPIMRESHAAQVEEGADIAFLDAAALSSRCPWINTEGLEGGFVGMSNEGWVDPYGLLMAFRRKALALGVEYVKDTATGVHRDGRRITGVELAGNGSVSAGVVVNTAGASGGRALARSAGVDVPIESRLRCSFVFECREDISAAPLTVLPEGVAWRPEGTRFITSITPPPERDPERFDFDIDHGLFEDLIWPPLAHWIPAFEAIKVVHSYSCHYDFNTLDENLILGLAAELENFYLALGFSGHGMQQSPAVGRALSELIAFGEFRSIDLTRFGYQRVIDGEGIHEANCW